MLDIPKFMRALEAAGVDDWTWYGASLEDLSEEDMQDDTLVYQALENGGVDNWEGYSEAFDIYKSAQDSNEDIEDEEASSVTQDTTATEEKPLDPAQIRLKSIVGEEEYERIKDTFWKRTTHPREFDRAMKVLSSGQGSFIDARMKYVDLVYGSKEK